MRTFKDIIETGIAQRNYTTILPETPETDPIVRTYNNCFGLFTDTHMSKLGEQDYVITGSLCRDPGLFNSFLYSVNFGLGTHFRTNYQIASVTSPSSWLSKNGLCGHFELLNGDHVYRIGACPVVYNNTLDYSACCMNCATDMPVQMSEKQLEVLSQLVETAKDTAELSAKVNENEYFNGNDWYCTGSANGLCLVSESTGKALLLEEMVDEAKTIKRYKITDHYAPMFGKDREYTAEGTLEELIKYYSYTLETGKSYEHEKGNKKINLTPKTIQQLCDNLEKAKNNAAANGYGGHFYSYEELKSE